MKRITRKLQAAIDLLEAQAHPVLPVRFEFMSQDGAYASCDVEDGEFVISLDPRLTTPIALHFLVHEWAHCLVWSDGPTIKDHGDAWSLVYGRLYRLVFED